MSAALSTLCYIEQDGAWLLMHRVKKKQDINRDKWIGVGGHLEAGESPEECLLREVREETGLTLTSWRMRGIVTFCCAETTEYMHLFTADHFEGTMIPSDACDEGRLEWVPFKETLSLPIWEGDRIFLTLLMENAPFFLLKLVYSAEGKLEQASLNGKDLALAC